MSRNITRLPTTGKGLSRYDVWLLSNGRFASTLVGTEKPKNAVRHVGEFIAYNKTEARTQACWRNSRYATKDGRKAY